MASDKTVLYYGRGRSGPSSHVSDFAAENELEVVSIEQSAEVRALLNRTMPACLFLETSNQNGEMVALVKMLKEDFFTDIIPLVVLVGGDAATTRSADLLQAGAGEVVQDSLPERERKLRLEQVLKRTDRDVSVHPTTRLPGTNHIALDVGKRRGVGEKFNVCYADLDAMIGELAPEMKTYAKSLPGSKYVVDQRHQSPTLETAAATEAESVARSPSPTVPAEANT